MDPRGWDAEMDLSISVGLGIGSKAEQIGQAETVLAAMERLASSPYRWLVRPEHVHAAIVRLYNAAGIRNVDDYLGDPGQSPDVELPDPKADAAAAGLEMRRQEAAARLQLAREESSGKLQLLREEAAARLAAARDKASTEAQLARERMALETALERERLAARAAATGEADAAAVAAHRPGGDLDK
jgi:hypothetical protein